ncbi:MAG: HD domain-containing protein [Campylobacterota bacterium]|nr:HD domain-containing protein [Campylobacterota bacterium]
MSGFMFAENKKETPTDSSSSENILAWKVLIVDDEKDIHAVTELSLGNFEFDGQKLHFISAYSAKEAEGVLQKHNDIALVLLDVVMESDYAGLELVKYIRNTLNNSLIRIVLRTGQPGSAPEEEVIKSYDINDYKDKTELTSIKLKSTVHNAIKSYRDMVALDENASTLLKYKNMFDSASDFIFVVDKESKIIEANNAFLKVIGKSHTDTIGTSLYDIFAFKDRESELKKSIESSSGGENVRFTSELLFDTLGKCYVNIESFPYFDENHNLTAIVVNVQDITKDVKHQELTDTLKNSQIANYEQTVYSFVDMIEKRDSFTAGHTTRVAQYAKSIASQMNLKQDEIDLLYQAAMLHDIGKVTTPDSILLKPGKFNDLEYALIKEHLNTGYELLKKVDMYAELAEVMVLHHERYDGKGYPNGLKGDEISIMGHIMIVADAFDAMTTNRIYKRRKELDAAFDEMLDLKAKQFHPDVVDAALIALKDIEIVASDQLPHSKAEKARFAYFFKDPLTKTYNEDYLNTVLSIEKGIYTQVHYLAVHNMSQYNNLKGWKNGDILLRNIANTVHEHYPLYLKFRVHGDDFFLLGKGSNGIDIDTLNARPEILQSGIKLSVQSLSLEGKDINTVEELENYFNL